jgi:hypothetical protein
MDSAIYAIAMFFWGLSGRVQHLAWRGGFDVDIIGAVPPARWLLALASFGAFIASAAWGFLNMEWWVALTILIVPQIVAGFLIGRAAFTFFAANKWFLDAVVVGLCVYLWFFS